MFQSGSSQEGETEASFLSHPIMLAFGNMPLAYVTIMVRNHYAFQSIIFKNINSLALKKLERTILVIYGFTFATLNHNN
jgi:hypothetical protein